jgi:hypothetical protein
MGRPRRLTTPAVEIQGAAGSLVGRPSGVRGERRVPASRALGDPRAKHRARPGRRSAARRAARETPGRRARTEGLSMVRRGPRGTEGHLVLTVHHPVLTEGRHLAGLFRSSTR